MVAFYLVALVFSSKKNKRFLDKVDKVTGNCPEVYSSKGFVKKMWAQNEFNENSEHICKRFAYGFPSLGGFGCSCPCVNLNSSYTSAFLPSSDQSWPRDLLSNFEKVGQIFRDFENKQQIKSVFNSSCSSSTKCPLIFLYHCCIDAKQKSAIQNIYTSQMPSTATMVRFSKLTCMLMGPGTDSTIFLTLDHSSARALSLRAAIISRQQNLYYEETKRPGKSRNQFGIVLGTVPYDYPCKSALTIINDEIERWTDAPVALETISLL